MDDQPDVLIDEDTLNMMDLTRAELDKMLKEDFKEGKDYKEITGDEDVDNMRNGVQYMHDWNEKMSKIFVLSYVNDMLSKKTKASPKNKKNKREGS